MNIEDPYNRAASWRGGITRHVPLDSSCESCMALVQHWIRGCVDTHPDCVKKTRHSSKRYPKRLLAIGSSGRDDTCIIETEQMATSLNQPYVALSHCWGSSQHLLSKRETINTWKQKIPWAKLPKTFCDAIIISRHLGIEYLWIDSLCVIQDDTRDWELEAANMGEIYSNAFLVIAASSSVDGDGGCFLERPKYFVIEGEDERHEMFHTYVRHYRRHALFGWDTKHGLERGDQSTTKDEEPNFPLFGRAWCFQERLLGTRVLHYTDKEIIFECLTLTNCECGALTNFKGDPALKLRRTISNLPVQTSAELEATELEYWGGRKARRKDVFRTWRDLVAAYTRRSLTYSTDVLPALSGLAERWSSKTESEYLGGLWRKDLLRDLLWVSTTPEQDRELPYLAPTWSWASIQRAVQWIHPGHRTDYLVTIDNVNTVCARKGQNQFGELITGWLFLTGPVIRCTISSVIGDNSSQTVWLKSDQFGGNHAFEADHRKRCIQLIGSNVLCVKYCTDVVNEESGGGFHRALILASPPSKDLERLPELIRRHANVYQRIGVMQFYPTEDWDNGASSEVISMYLV